MEFFAVGHRAVGVIAIGQEAVGVIAIGQLALGVVSIGQLSRGLFAVGQLAVGVRAYGQVAVALDRCGGMLAFGGRAVGMLPLSIVPRPKVEQLPVPVSLDAVRSGALANGWIRVTLHARDGDFTVRCDGAPLAVDFAESVRGTAYGYGLRDVEALIMVRGVEHVSVAAEHGYRAAPEYTTARTLACDAVVEVPPPWWRAVMRQESGELPLVLQRLRRSVKGVGLTRTRWPGPLGATMLTSTPAGGTI